jgi:type IV pilus assembly protein PilE
MESNAAKSLCRQFSLRSSRECGFTLIELMIAVAVVGILTAVAIPAYSDYLRRGKIPEATSTLASMRVKLEQYFQDNRNYGSSAAACGVANPTGNNFTFTCNWGAGATNQSYLLTATGVGSMAGFSYTIDQGGLQGSTAWGTTSTSCWITKKGGSC